MKPCKMTIPTVLIVGIMVLAAPACHGSESLGPCFINGDITAARNLDQPELGQWRYTLRIVWDTGGKHSMSHFNLGFGESPECSCDELNSGLRWQQFLGWSSGLNRAEATGYRCGMECDGDPSIGLRGPMMKMEPDQKTTREPGVQGRGEFEFYSEYAPWRIHEANQYMSMKFAREGFCTGPLTGVFPGLPCDPTPAEPASWSAIKEYYR